MQNKLLRALETRQVMPVGSDLTQDIDVRLISATNQPLETLVAEQQFREDLLYRINTIEIVLPPLRDRPDDLAPLVEHFVALSARKYRLAQKPVTAAALRALREHHWPGNIRELSHAVERALILSDRDELDAADFSFGTPRAAAATLNLERIERETIAQALHEAEGNISHAAQALGITRASLYRRIEKHGL